MGEAQRATAGAAVLLLLLMALCSVRTSEAQSVVCNMTADDLNNCKPAVTRGADPPPAPTPDCCAGLGKADLPCLCSYKNSFLLPALGIDPDLAMQLPVKCSLTQAPPQC